MKVTCEYCESVVDAERTTPVPTAARRWRTAERQRRQSCARLRRKRSLRARGARKQHKLEQERIEAERGKMILDAVTNVTGRAHSVRNSRALKAGCLIPIVVIALIIILSIAFSVIRQISGGSVDDLLSGVVSENSPTTKKRK